MLINFVTEVTLVSTAFCDGENYKQTRKESKKKCHLLQHTNKLLIIIMMVIAMMSIWGSVCLYTFTDQI